MYLCGVYQPGTFNITDANIASIGVYCHLDHPVLISNESLSNTKGFHRLSILIESFIPYMVIVGVAFGLFQAA